MEKTDKPVVIVVYKSAEPEVVMGDDVAYGIDTVSEFVLANKFPSVGRVVRTNSVRAPEMHGTGLSVLIACSRRNF
jgi:hypothetical protein